MGNIQSNSQYSHKYETGKLIGNGTFASVKKCKRKADSKEYAVKIINKTFLTIKEYFNIQDEIKILQTLNHPNIIKIIDVYESDFEIKIVLELCPGGHLFDQISKSPLKRFDEKKAANILYILANIINYSHNNYIIHRDIKPENILFDCNGIIKLCDFGLAHYLKLKPQHHVMHSFVGTPLYIAPEIIRYYDQLDNLPTYGYEVDYWSLGVILYNMLSGLQPFYSNNNIPLMYKNILNGGYNFNDPVWNTVSNEAKSCVEGLMNVNPQERFNYDKLINHEWIQKHVDIIKQDVKHVYDNPNELPYDFIRNEIKTEPDKQIKPSS